MNKTILVSTWSDWNFIHSDFWWKILCRGSMQHYRRHLKREYYEWRKFVRGYQPCIAFKIHCTAADKDRINNKTLPNTSYHNTNNTTENDWTAATTITTACNTTSGANNSVLTEAISMQILTNHVNFTKILENFETQGKITKTNNRYNGTRNGSQLSYC